MDDEHQHFSIYVISDNESINEDQDQRRNASVTHEFVEFIPEGPPGRSSLYLDSVRNCLTTASVDAAQKSSLHLALCSGN